MSLDTCANCEYFQPGDDGVEFAEGECRVRSPHARWGFPQVSGKEWCGMFSSSVVVVPRPPFVPIDDIHTFDDPTYT